jgi:hypothetical protein
MKVRNFLLVILWKFYELLLMDNTADLIINPLGEW